MELLRRLLLYKIEQICWEMEKMRELMMEEYLNHGAQKKPEREQERDEEERALVVLEMTTFCLKKFRER